MVAAELEDTRPNPQVRACSRPVSRAENPSPGAPSPEWWSRTGFTGGVGHAGSTGFLRHRRQCKPHSTLTLGFLRSGGNPPTCSAERVSVGLSFSSATPTAHSRNVAPEADTTSGRISVHSLLSLLPTELTHPCHISSYKSALSGRLHLRICNPIRFRIVHTRPTAALISHHPPFLVEPLVGLNPPSPTVGQ